MDSRLRVVPDLHSPESDAEKYRAEHKYLFGHFPPLDPRDKCRHPIHDKIRRAMNGAHIEVPFDDRDIASDDTVAAAEAIDRYNAVYSQTQQMQAEVELHQKIDNARKLGLILPDRIY